MTDLNAARDKVLRENTAQTVHKYLESVTNNRAEYARRWIWELLQNARDAAKKHPASISATADAQRFIFQHDGAPFRDEEIAHLIYYGSSKHDPTANDNVGRFGSGFLITHVLAPEITVTGQLDTDDSPIQMFRFTLKRSGNNATEMSASMDDSWNAFIASRTTSDGTPSAYTTTYEYPLTPATRAFATTGLATLDDLAPYALACNTKLRELRITQDGQTKTISIPQGSAPELLAPGITRTPVRTTANGTTREQDLITATDDNVSIAIITETDGNRTRITPPGDAPRLFIAFPLFGTERFCFPTIINSETFKPQEKRDSIFLGTDDTPYVRDNKARIANACALYQRLLTVAGAQGWDGLHRLATLPPPSEYNWLDSNWYTKLLQEQAVTPARAARILRTTTGAYAAPSTSTLPLPTSQYTAAELWDLTSRLASKHDTLPQRVDTDGWATALEGWAIIADQAVSTFPESWTLEKLARAISEHETITHLQADLGTTDAIEWLTMVYELIDRAARRDLFDNQPILPDQNGMLRSRSTLYQDHNISDELKDIARTINVLARAVLLDKRITTKSIPELTPKTEADLLSQLIQAIKHKPDERSSNEDYRGANITLFAWLAKTGHLDLLDGYPVLAQDERDDKPSIIRLTTSQNDPELVPLTPVTTWPEPARGFADLFPERHTMNNRYATALNDTTAWDEIACAGYVRRDPVFTTSTRENDLLPVTPLPDGDDQKQKHRLTQDASVTRISFLKQKDTGVMDRARNSQPRARQLLHFLVDYATRPTTFEHASLNCECGATHEYYHAAWLQPIANRNWVPIGERQHATPTAETFTALLQQQTDFLRHLALQCGPLLQSLGINGSDLLLRLATKSEAERVALVATAVDLTAALGNDTTKLQAIAQALKDDPDVINDIAEASARRGKVRRNQTIGKTVEDMLRALLEAPGTGLTVTRRRIGHDFEIEHDIIETIDGEPIEYGWEIANKKTRFLLEVKASTAQHYRMTPKQAETAVANGKHFVLCMVNLPPETDITPDHVLAGARFVPTISRDLDSLYRELTTFETLQATLPTTDGDIELEIQDAQVRFKIGQEHWEGGLTFAQAVEHFKTNPDSTTPL